MGVPAGAGGERLVKSHAFCRAPVGRAGCPIRRHQHAAICHCLVATAEAYTPAATMRRRHLNWLCLWILPLLLARALIPAGFMLSVDAGQLQLMFCPSAVVQLPGKHGGEHDHGAGHDQHQAHAEHHPGMHHGGTDHASSHAQDNAPCPFSLAASATPSQVAYFSDAVAAPSDERFHFLSAPTFSVGPVRTDPIRGPPSLA